MNRIETLLTHFVPAVEAKGRFPIPHAAGIVGHVVGVDIQPPLTADHDIRPHAGIVHMRVGLIFNPPNAPVKVPDIDVKPLRSFWCPVGTHDLGGMRAGDKVKLHIEGVAEYWPPLPRIKEVVSHELGERPTRLQKLANELVLLQVRHALKLVPVHIAPKKGL